MQESVSDVQASDVSNSLAVWMKVRMVQGWCGESIFLKTFLYFNSVCTSVWLHVCMCTMHVSDAYTGQKRASDCLEPEVQMVVSRHADAGTEP